MGLIRVHPLLAVGLNLVAVGGLAPTVWGWRATPVWRWFVLGPASAWPAAWLALLALWRLGDRQRVGQRWPPERTPSSTSSHAGTGGLPLRARRGRALAARAGRGLLGDGSAPAIGRRRFVEVELRARATGRSGRAKSGSISSQAASSNGGDGAAVRAGGEPEVRDVVRPAGLPRQLHGPAAVLVAPGIPGGGVGVQAAGDQRGGHGLQQRQHRGPVGEHRDAPRLPARPRASVPAAPGGRTARPATMSTPAAAATCSTDAPARILA